MASVFAGLITSLILSLTIVRNSYKETLILVTFYISLPPILLIYFGSTYSDCISDIFILMSHIVAIMTIIFTSLYFDITYDYKALLKFKLTLASIIVMTLMMDVLFLTDNILIIFFLAELSLLPLGFLMMKDSTIFWRSLFEFVYENKRPLAFYYLVYFTVASGGVGLLGIVLLYFSFGSLSLDYLIHSSFDNSFLLNNHTLLTFTFFTLLLWISIKAPLAPVHIWLPKAHVEGSTESSMLLAGIVLKVTTYVLIRLSQIPIFFVLFDQYRPFLLSIAVTTSIVGAFGSLFTSDMKRITAYSSVSHMGLILAAGFFLTASSSALAPYIILLMTHTVVSTAMFMFIGCFYKSRNNLLVSRNRLAYGGLCNIFPIFAVFGVIIFANLNIPLTMGFVGELGTLLVVVSSGLTVGFLLCLASFVLLFPMLSMLVQVIMGPMRLTDHFKFSSDETIGISFFYKQLIFNKFSWSNTFLLFYQSKKIYFYSIFLIVICFGVFSSLFVNFLEESIIIFFN